MVFSYINDSYKRARGKSHILDICCEHCDRHICFYQKDGGGSLRRMYVDRFVDYRPEGDELICSSCHRILGTKIVYEKESRSAYRLYVDAVSKKIIAKKEVSGS